MNNQLVKQLREIAIQYPEVEAILLFGSRAYDDYTDVSDIDLAIKAPKLSDMKWLLLTEQIESELHTLLKIDTVLYEKTSETLRREIDRCYKVLYESLTP